MGKLPVGVGGPGGTPLLPRGRRAGQPGADTGEGVVMAGGGMAAVTASERLADAVLAGLWLSVTVTVMGKLPVAVGVPAMTPLLPRERPAGKPVRDQV